MQTRLESFIESKANIIVGAPLNYALNFLLVGLLKGPLTNGEHWAFGVMTVVFTFSSIARSYSIRRFFNWYKHIRGRDETSNN